MERAFGHSSTEKGSIPEILVRPVGRLHGFHVHPVNSAPAAECLMQVEYNAFISQIILSLSLLSASRFKL